MTTLLTTIKVNPVRAMAILNTLIVLVVAFGFQLTTTQIAAITGFAAAILGLGGELVRSQVTPTATLPDAVAAAVTQQSHADVPKQPVAIVSPADTVVATTNVPAAAPAAPAASGFNLHEKGH